MDDPFVSNYRTSEFQIAGEFLTNWLPFLTKDLCNNCSTTIRDRVRSLDPGARAFSGDGEEDLHDPTPERPSESTMSCSHIESNWLDRERTPDSSKARISLVDIAQEDELEEEEEMRRQCLEVEKEEEVKRKPELLRDEMELTGFTNVGRKKDFKCIERVKGTMVNTVDGLELHTGVFSAVEQKQIVDFVYELQEKGRDNQLEEYTYSEPKRWKRGKGRVTIQFGCCYNYVLDNQGNPPGIRQSVVTDPMPPPFKAIIRRLVQWHVMPTSCVPDSCIVNMSVLIFNGNGADVAKHCVSAVSTRRISITFRKMKENKRPTGFIPERDLLNVQPLPYDSGKHTKRSQPRNTDKQPVIGKNLKKGKEIVRRLVGFEPNPGLHISPRPLHDSDMPTGTSAQRIMDGRHPVNSRNSDRGKESARRARPDFQGSQHFQEVVDMFTKAAFFNRKIEWKREKERKRKREREREREMDPTLPIHVWQAMDEEASIAASLRTSEPRLLGFVYEPNNRRLKS